MSLPSPDPAVSFVHPLDKDFCGSEFPIKKHEEPSVKLLILISQLHKPQ